jgi:cell division protease FtsH
MPNGDESQREEKFREKLSQFFRSMDPEERRKQKLPPKANFSIWYFLIVFLTLIMIQNYFLAPRVETIPYSKFKQLVAEGQVTNVTIGPESITGTMKGKEGKPDQEFITVRVDDPTLVKELDEKKIQYTGLYQSKFLNNLLSWILPLGIFFLIWRYAIKRMGPGYGVMSFGKSKAKLYAEEDINSHFRGCGRDRRGQGGTPGEWWSFCGIPSKFQRLGGRIPKGVLSGRGLRGREKPFWPEAVAGEAKVPFFSMSGSEFVEMFVGVGAARVRDLFSQASSQAPCIIFVDELDALGKARGINRHGRPRRAGTNPQPACWSRWTGSIPKKG